MIRYKTQKIDEDHQEADKTFARCTLLLRELNSQVEISTHSPSPPSHPLTLVFSTTAVHLCIISTHELVSNTDGLKLWMEAQGEGFDLNSSGQVASAGWETAHELQSRHCALTLPRSQHDWDYASSARAGQTPHNHTVNR